MGKITEKRRILSIIIMTVFASAFACAFLYSLDFVYELLTLNDIPITPYSVAGFYFLSLFFSLFFFIYMYEAVMELTYGFPKSGGELFQYITRVTVCNPVGLFWTFMTYGIFVMYIVEKLTGIYMLTADSGLPHLLVCLFLIVSFVVALDVREGLLVEGWGWLEPPNQPPSDSLEGF